MPDIAKELQRQIASLQGLPALPHLARELLRLNALRGADLEEMSAIVSFDPALGQVLLNAANARPEGRAVREVEDALAQLGLGGARKAVFRAVAMGLFPVDAARSLDRQAFWKHASASAAYAERIAQHLKSPHADEAYVAGLLHDIGRAALDAIAPQHPVRALGMGPAQGLHLLEAERRELGVDHTLAGKWLIEAWGLPEAYVAAAWLHHQPAAALEHTPCPRQLVEIVALADMLASARVSGLPRATALPAAAEELRKRLGLDSDLLTQLLAAGTPEALPAKLDDLAPPARPSDSHAGQRKLERALARYRALHEFNLALGALSDRRAVLHALVERLQKVCSLGAGLCLATGPGDAALDGLAWTDMDNAPRAFTVPCGGAADAVRQAIFAQLDAIAHGDAKHGFVSAPLINEGVQLGQIVYDAAAARTHGAQEDLEALGTFADAAAVALARCVAMRQADARSEGLATALWKNELAYRQTVQSERLASVGKMAAGAAHEINNPLAIIAGRAQLLLTRSQNPDDARALEAIIEQSRRATKVLADLLKFARPGEMNRQPAAPQQLLHQVVGALRDRLEAEHIQIIEDYAPALPRTRADRRQLEEVFVNLILNAQQAMPAGGTLTLRVRPGHDRQALVIQIIDTGQGIPPDVLDRVFEPFFSTRSDKGGTGLGLSVCHGIIEAHRGGITLHSTPGGGTTCTITLPAESEERVVHAPEVSPTAKTPTPQARPVHATPAQAARILIVDDDEDLRAVLGEALQSRGYDVQLAADGHEGLAAILSDAPELILLDLHVPNLDGLSLLRQIQARGMKIPVLLMNALATHEEVQDAMALGARGVLQKPFEIARLYAELAAILPQRNVA